MAAKLERWSDDRIWRSFAEWRWVPPSAHPLPTETCFLVVTPEAPELSYAYGFDVPPSADPELALDRLREQVTALGGRGVKVQVTPTSRPADLATRLLRRGYAAADETEVLAWELRHPDGSPRLPGFATPGSVRVQEVMTDPDYDRFTALSTPIFGDPPPPPSTQAAFRASIQETIRRTGHSGRYLAWRGSEAVGRAGVEVAGPVARFWGSGVLEAHRHQGIYGALVEIRCRDGAEQGATLALVTARVGSSGPILKRRGFRALGSVRMFVGRW